MQLSLFLTLILLCFSPSLSQASVACPENNVVYKGITCCIDQISQSRCQELIDTKIPEEIIEDIRWVQTNYEKGRYPYGRVPNCFWNALNFMGLYDQGAHQALDSYVFIPKLIDHGLQSKDHGEVLPMSLVVLRMQGKRRDDIMENNSKKRVWRPYSETVHALIHLEDGIIFQKESVLSDVFSIDSLDNSLKAYERSFNQEPRFQVQGALEVWY